MGLLGNLIKQALNPQPAFVWSGAGLPPERLRMIALAGPYLYGMGAVDQLASHDCSTHPAGQCPVDAAQQEAWGITDRASALETIGRLIDGLHAPEYAVIADLVAAEQNPDAPHATRQEAIVEAARRAYVRATSSVPEGAELTPEGEQLVQEHVAQVIGAARDFAATTASDPLLAHPLPTDIAAWDIARAANLVRLHHSLGRIEADEAWGLLGQLVDQAQARYPDWTAYGEAHLAGRAYWLHAQGGASTLPSTLRDGRDRLMQLADDPRSPWKAVPLRWAS